MAALIRPTEATYVLHDRITVDTSDHEDHTFCGVVFPVECKCWLPIDHMVITSLSVRGMLGPLTVWVSKDPDAETSEGGDTTATNPNNNTINSSSTGTASARRRGRPLSVEKSSWTKVYEQNHPPSMHQFVDLKLDTPLKLKPDQVRGIYVHSTLGGDEAIVYDNQKGEYTHKDDFMRIHPAHAHLSNEPFGNTTLWGYGSAWRQNREFVGRISYGIVYKLWNPQEYFNFGSQFQSRTKIMFACQRRLECPIAMLPDDVIFYILNMCRWDWFDDSPDEVEVLMKAKMGIEDEDESSSEDDEDETMHFNPSRRASNERRHWARMSNHSQFLANLRRGILLGGSSFVGFPGSNLNIELLHDEEESDGFDMDDDDDDDDEEWEEE